MSNLFPVEPASEVQCLDCEHFSPRRAIPDLAMLGFGHCAKLSMSRGHTFSAAYKRRCAQHKPVDAQAAEKRRAWYGSLK